MPQNIRSFPIFQHANHSNGSQFLSFKLFNAQSLQCVKIFQDLHFNFKNSVYITVQTSRCSAKNTSLFQHLKLFEKE